MHKLSPCEFTNIVEKQNDHRNSVLLNDLSELVLWTSFLALSMSSSVSVTQFTIYVVKALKEVLKPMNHVSPFLS